MLGRLVLLTLVCLTATHRLPAQPGNATLIVSLSDQLGNIIPGADLTLTGPDSTKIRLESNDNGIGEFRRLAAGKYQLVIKLRGFSDSKKEDLVLAAGQTKRLDVILEPAPIESTVSVDDSSSTTDMSSDGVTRDLTEAQLENLPEDPEQLSRMLRSIAGQSPTGEDLPFSVNGMPGAPIPSKANIKMVRVNRNIFSAQYEGTYGGGIEIFSSSNLKKLSGRFGYTYFNSRFSAADPYLGRRAPSQNHSENYSFSGPLRKNTSLSVFANHSQVNGSSVVNATVLDANLNIVNLRQTLPSRSNFNFMNIGLESDLNKQHKLVVSYNLQGSRNSAGSVSGLTLPERAERYRYINHYLGVSDTNVVNPNLVITTRFLFAFSENRNVGDLVHPSINVLEAFNGGGSQNYRVSSNKRYELYSDINRRIKRWTVQFGASFRGTGLNDESRSNFGGSYTFTGRIAPVLNANNDPVRDTAGNLVTTQITSIESYRRTLLLQRLGFSAAEIRLRGGGADQLTLAGGLPSLGVRQFDFAVYQQNSYSLTETIGLSFGVRYENQTNVDSKFNIAPRFGFVWQPKEKEKQRPITVLPRITLGYGLFFSRFDASRVISSRLANDERRQLFFITDPNILDVFPSVPAVNALTASNTLRSLRLIAPGLQTPRQNLFTATMTKKLWHGFTVNTSFTHGEGYRLALNRNINAPVAPFGSTLVYPFGNARSIQEVRSIGRSRTDRFSTSLGFPQWKPWKQETYFSLQYGYNRIKTDNSSGSSSPFDPYDYSQDWGFDQPSGVHSINGYFNMGLTRGFSMACSYQVRSGYRYNITTGRDTNKDGFYSERPAYASDPKKAGVIPTPYGLLDPNPAPGDRIIPRNLGVGPMARNIDLYLSKTFGIHPDTKNKNTPRQRLSFSVNVSNLFNFNNKGNPIGNMSSPNFLKVINGGSAWGPFGGTNPRSMNFSSSYSF